MHELPVHTHSAHQTFLRLTLSPPVSHSSVSLPSSAVPTVVPAVVDPIAFSYAKLVVPLFVLPLAAGDGILEVPCHVDSCGKFVFPSQYRPVLIFEVPCHMENSSSHLNTGQFLSLKSHVMW